MAESDEEQWSLASQGRVLCQQYVIARSLKAGAQLKKIRCVSLMAPMNFIGKFIDGTSVYERSVTRTKMGVVLSKCIVHHLVFLKTLLFTYLLRRLFATAWVQYISHEKCTNPYKKRG